MSIYSRKEQEKIQLKKEQVLSLDMANHCGYYNPLLGFGTLDLTESKARNDNKQHKQFHDTIKKWIIDYDIKQVVAEDFNVFQGGQVVSIKKLLEYRGILLYICDELNLPEPCFINPTTAKSWLTGNGSATKKDMCDMIKRRFGIDTKGDDNAADAATFWFLYCKRFNLI